MSALTDYAENKVLDHFLGTTAYTFVGQLYLALFTAAPNDAGGGTEVSTGGYARQTIDFGAAAAGVASNSNAPTFPASADWGAITHWVLFDALTVGNRILWGSFTTPRTILTGDSFQVPIGDIDVTAA